MNTTILKWIIGLFVASVIIALGWFFLGKSEKASPTTQEPVTLPSSGRTTVTPASTTPERNEIVIALRDGSAIVPDFVHNGVTLKDEVNSGWYLLAGNLGYCYPDTSKCQAGAPAPYEISYNAQHHSFLITLTKEPLGEARKEMELFLAKTLRLTPEKMCALNYSVGVTRYVNEEFATKELGFSFCPGAVVLP